MCRCPIDSSQLIEVLPEPAAADDDDSEGCADAGKAPGKAQRARLLQSAKLQALLGHLKAAAAGEGLKHDKHVSGIASSASGFAFKARRAAPRGDKAAYECRV